MDIARIRQVLHQRKNQAARSRQMLAQSTQIIAAIRESNDNIRTQNEVLLISQY